jgi:hypothetical protein
MTKQILTLIKQISTNSNVVAEVSTVSSYNKFAANKSKGKLNVNSSSKIVPTDFQIKSSQEKAPV